MFSVFVNIYNLIKRNRLISGVILAILLVFMLFSLTKLKFVEDYSRIFPLKKEIKTYNQVISNSEFLNRLIFNVSYKDTTLYQADPENLVNITQAFIDTAQKVLNPKYIDEFYFQADDGLMDKMFGLFYQHIPFYLDSADYNRLEDLFEYENLNEKLYGNFKILMSPSGMVANKYLFKDPLQLVLPKLNLLRDIQVDKSLELYNGYFFTQNRSNLVFFALPANSENTKLNIQLTSHLDDLIKQITEKHPEIDISYYGAAVIAAANAKRIQTDIQLTISIVLVILTVWLTTYFRRFKSVVFILIPVIVGALAGLSVLAWVTNGISALSVAIGSVILGISVDYALHLLTHFKQSGKIKETLGNISEPVIMSSLTTGVAFLCLIFLTSTILTHLGIFASVSVVIASLTALIIIPQLLSDQISNTSETKTHLLEKIAAYKFHKNKWLVVAIMIFSFATFPFIKRVTFEGDLEKSNYLDQQLKTAEQKIKSTSDISQQTLFLFSSGKNLNDALGSLEKSYPQIKNLVETDSLGEFFSVHNLLLSKEQQQHKINQWNSFWYEHDRTQFETLIIAAGNAIGFKAKAFEDLFAMINKEYEVINPVDLTRQFGELTENFIINIDDSLLITSLVKLNPSADKEKIYTLTNTLNNTASFDKKHLAETLFGYLKDDFNNLVWYSLLAVFIILFLFFGRLELALVTFLPMLVSYGFTLGIMGLMGIKFNIFNVIISTFIFGLGIDYSIFITKGLLNQYKKGINDLDAFKTSILLSSVTTLLGIGALIFAKHPALQSIALLSIIGIVSVVLISFTIQPVLVTLFVPLHRKNKRKLALTLSMLFFSFISFLMFALVSLLVTLMIPFIKILPFSLRRRRKILHFLICNLNSVLVHTNAHVRKRKLNFSKQLFDEPSVIIMNHQSVVDLLLVTSMSPKLIIMVKDWVWNSIFFGGIVRFLGYINVSEGFDDYMPKIRERVAEGYSVMVFPEGSRTPSGKIRRFHKGAFYLAKELNLPVLPVVLHGAYDTLPKGTFLVAPGKISMKFLPKIYPDDKSFGETYQESTKKIQTYMRDEYNHLAESIENTRYYKHKLLNNYIFKGPVIENYQRIKLKMDNYYKDYIDLIPRESKIYDLGCGMGALSLMLSYTCKERYITGIDYDKEKINIAQNCVFDPDRVQFFNANIVNFDYEVADVFILSDVLHYLEKEKQQQLLLTCAKNLNKHGVIIIRDGNTSLKSKHGMTKLTEFLSTNIGFNKKENELYYLSDKELKDFAAHNGFIFSIHSNSKHTSNQIYILRKDAHA